MFPLVEAELSGVALDIVGSQPTARVEALSSDRVRVLGYVPNLAPKLQTYRLSVAPLRYGAGVKGKVNQSLAHGLPCVATEIASEGMHLRDGVDIMIASAAASFAAAVTRVYRDEALWARLSESGLRNTRDHFSPEVADEQLKRLWAEIGVT